MENNFKSLEQEQPLVLIEFAAAWCGPCQTLVPVIEEIKTHFDGGLKILKIDIDENQMITQKFQIRSVPTMILFAQGKQVWRKAGLVTKRNIMDEVSSYIK